MDNQEVGRTVPDGLSPCGSSQQAVSPVPASIPCADDVRLLSAGPDSRGGFTFSFADGNEGGVIHMLAAHLYNMMGCGTPHELNCVQMEVCPRGGSQQFTLTLQRAGGKTPLRLKEEAVRLLQQTLDAIETGRSEPLFIMRDVIRNWLAEDITAQGTEAHRAETVEQGSVHDGPVAESDAPNSSRPNNTHNKGETSS